jgi:hypothetical protein
MSNPFLDGLVALVTQRRTEYKGYEISTILLTQYNDDLYETVIFDGGTTVWERRSHDRAELIAEAKQAIDDGGLKDVYA